MFEKTVFSPLILVLAVGQIVAAEPLPGKVSGIVVSVANGEFLNGAAIVVHPSGQVLTSDLDGIFEAELPAGKYKLTVTYDGYQEQSVTGVRIESRKTTYQDIALTPRTMSLGSVTVVAEASKASTQALLAERKNLATLSDSIGSQEMSRLTGGDAADVMSRVTGVSVVDDKYVFVRGLGERYSNTMLNGAILPSTQPDKKVVPMDIFPASLLENVRTEKSYTPDQPGDFSGGLIKVQTKDFPRRATMRMSFKQGFGTNTTFDDFLTYPGGGRDWFGTDDGTRAVPRIIPDGKLFRKSRFSSGGFSPEELQTFGRAFADTWTPRPSRQAPPDTSFNVVAGNTFRRLGLVFALNYSNKFNNQREERNFYKVGAGGDVERIHDYDFNISTFSVRAGVTANAAYELTDSNRLLFRNFFTRDTSDESRFFEGFNGDANNPIRNQRLRFVEEGLYSGQVGGEHYLGVLGSSFLEWRLTYSTSYLDEPDIREVLYEQQGSRFVLANESQSGFRMFNDLTEKLWEPAFDWTTFFTGGGVAGSIKLGVLYRDRSRRFLSRRFRFISRGTSGIDLAAPAEELFSSENISPSGFEVFESTRGTDKYAAQQINRSAYGMLDLNWNRWRFIGGVRVENDGQNVTTVDPFDPAPENALTSRLENRDVLGSAGAIFRLTPDMNLRGSISRTLNRPEFRELSPFEFTDVVGGRSVVGNPDLVRALIRNLDFRWEWFLNGEELVSASFFYKHFENPIERVIQPTAQLQTSFMNAEEARNLGFELDTRKSLGFLSAGLENFSFQGNYTFVDSEVTIPASQLNVLTSLTRPLAGQSRHVFNGIFEFAHPGSRSVARLLFNFQGQRITDVGALGLPEIVQSGYPRLDVIFLQPIGEKWGLKFTAENLLDQTHEFLQGDQLQRAFRTGRYFSVSLSYEFFGE